MDEGFVGAIRMDEVPLGRNQFGVKARRLLETDGFRVMNLVIEPGEMVPEHSSPVEVVFYVVSGSGEIAVGGRKYGVKARDILPCPKETPMSLRAGAETLAVLNIKAPNPSALGKGGRS